MDDKTQQLLNRVHTSIVDVITNGLEEGTITEDRAKLIAKMVLAKLPDDITYEELIKIIPKLDDEFAELSGAVVPIMVEYEEKMKTIINERITDLLKAKKFKEAQKIARKALEFEKGLS